MVTNQQRDDREIFRYMRDNDERSGQNSLSGKGSDGKESRLLLGESNPSIEVIPKPALDENFQEEIDINNIHNLVDLTDKILQQGEVENVML